jgi:hypothetical protein
MNEWVKSRSWSNTHRSVSQSVCLGVGHHFEAHDQTLLFTVFYRKIGLLLVLGRPLWREDGSVICTAICECSSPHTTGRATGGGILTSSHHIRSRSHVTTDGQCLCQGVEPILRLLTRHFFLSEGCCLVSVGRPLWREVGSVICHCQSVVIY